jgi:hypothetical protein
MTTIWTHRPWTRRALLLLALPALLAVASPGMSATAGATTIPTGIVCTTYHAQANTATIRFGDRNLNLAIESIPMGDDNYFTPPPTCPSSAPARNAAPASRD